MVLKIKLFVGFIFSIIALVNLILIFIIQTPEYKLNIETNYLLKHPTKDSLTRWASSIKSSKLFVDLVSSNTSITDIFEVYSKVVYKHNLVSTNLIKLINISGIQSYSKSEVEKFNTIIISDNNFPLNYNYIKQNGEDSISEYYKFTLKIDNIPLEINYRNKVISPGKDKIIVNGGKNIKKTDFDELKLYENSIQALKDNNINEYKKYNYQVDNSSFFKVSNYYNLDYIVSTTKYNNFSLNIENNILSRYIPIGNLKIEQLNCLDQPIEVIYDSILHDYYIKELDISFRSMCEPKLNEGFSNQLKCNDCFYSPVDRTTKLYSTYVPNLEEIKVNGSGSLVHLANNSLNNLFEDAKNKGIILTVVSSYRSYMEQEKTFVFWNNFEILQGATKDKAKELATRRVAPAGHSEHQLGTAVDLGCTLCDRSDSSYSNKLVYTYLEPTF